VVIVSTESFTDSSQADIVHCWVTRAVCTHYRAPSISMYLPLPGYYYY